jgi:two-component system, cell cycle sensor histidine kinase and response regulator CckA
MKKQIRFFQAFYLVSFFVLFAIGLSLAGYYFYHYQQKRLLQTAKDNLSSIAKLKVEQIENWRQERINDASFIFRSEAIAQQLSHFLKNPAGQAERNAILGWITPMFKNRQYVSMDIIGANGVPLFSNLNDSCTLSNDESKTFQEAMERKRILFVDLHIQDDGNVYMGIIVPIIQAEKRDTLVLGSLLMRIDPRRFLYPLLQAWPVLSKTSETLILRREGDEIIYLNELRHRKGAGLSYKRYIYEKKLPAAMAASGFEGVVEGIDYRQEEVVAHVKKVPNSPWYMVAKTDIEEVLAENTRIALMVTMVIALILLLLASGIRIIWKEQEVKQIQELLESEQERRALIQHFDYLMRYANDVILLANGDQRIIEANERAVQTYGYEHEELLNLHLTDLRSPNTPADIDKRLQSMMAPEGALYETDHKRKDGSIFPVEISGRTITIEGKTFYQGIIRDISERKEAEKILRAREKHLSMVTDNFPGLVSSVDKDLRYRFASGGYERVFGIPSMEVVGRTMSEVLGPETFKYIELFAAQALEGKQITFVNPITMPTGEISYGLTTFTPDTDSEGNVQGIFIFAIDITDRIQTEDALRENEEKYRKLIETTETGFVIVDDLGKVLDANPKYVSLTGHTHLDEIRNHSVLEWTAESEKERNAEAVKQCLTHGFIRNFEVDYVQKNGNNVAIEINATVVKTDYGVNILTLCRDITERKRAGEELLKLKKAIDTSGEAVFLTDRQGIFTFINPGFTELYGYEPEEILGKVTPRILKSGTVKKNIYENFWKALVSGKEVRGEHVNKRKDGTFIQVDGSACTIYDEGKRIIGFLGIQRDITERKKAEELLRFHEQEMRSLMNNLPEIIIRYDLQGRVLFVNSATTLWLGNQQENVLGKTLLEIGAPLEMAAKSDSRFKQVLESKRAAYGEDLFHGRDGLRFIETSTIPEYGSDGALVSVLSVSRDITERKRTEETLRKTEENFRRSLDDSPMGVRIVTSTGDTMYANRSLLDIYGYESLEELRRIHIKERYTPESYAEFQLRREKRNRGEFGPSEYEISIIRKNGEVRYIQVFRKEVLWNGAKQYQVIYQDITYRKKLEEPLRRMQKLEGLGTLAGGIAHDFNNILGIILGYASRIYAIKDDSEKLQHTIEIITKAVERGTTLVRQILTFARKTETEFRLININDVVKEIIGMIMETFPKIISYSQNLEKGIPSIHADHSQLHQALLNLCVNARDAMHNGGVLNISTGLVPGLHVRRRHPDAVADKYVCIEIGDTGEGMTSEIRNRIFEPFFSTKEKGKGTGLGLAVVFGVVQTHRGFIDVESELGKGAIFRLYLPAPQQAEQLEAEVQETIKEIPGGTETVLIVEDEEALNAMLVASLTTKGYTVYTAFDGLTAVKIYKEKQKEISLVLTDIGLPKMTGMDEFRLIKKLNPNVRIIVATGYLDPEMRSEFLKAGVQKFLYKPYNPKDVLKAMREVLDSDYSV